MQMTMKNQTPIYFDNSDLAVQLINLLGNGYFLQSISGVIVAKKKQAWSAPEIEIEEIELKSLDEKKTPL